MASYLDKTRIKTAVTDNTKLDLGHQVVTTMDAFQLNVAECMELVPNERIDVRMETFCRLNPMPVPGFSRMSIRNRAFFVPFRTLFRGANDFFTDAVHIASDGGGNPLLLPNVPIVDMEDIASAFKNSIVSTPDGAGFLYAVPGGALGDVTWNGTNYYNYTIRGRMAIKNLENLGYKVDYLAKQDDCTLSALPLLAFCRCWIDWYYPTQYSNVALYDRLLGILNYDTSIGAYALTATDVATILDACSYVMYDSSLFVSAWDTPDSPNPGNYSSDFKIQNIDTIGNIYGSSNYTNLISLNGVTNRGAAGVNTGDAMDRYGGLNAPFITLYADNQNTGGSKVAVTGAISEYLLNALGSLTDYMKRHQLAGSRNTDRWLARWGKAIPAEKLNRSQYLGSHVQDIQIGDVTSTSDTANSLAGTGSQLGSMAGRGIGYCDGHWSYSADEYGYFVVLSSIVPHTGYFQGLDPKCQRISKLDFYTPEFDCLGVEALPSTALYMPQNPTEFTLGSQYTQTFGYVPRYATYKDPTCMDRVTGNFRLLSINGGDPYASVSYNAADAWYSNRLFSGSDFSGDWSNVVHSIDFVSGKSDFSQYKRLFYDIDADAPDNFTVIHNYEIAAWFPGKSAFDEYEFHQDGGKDITMETNGVKLN